MSTHDSQTVDYRHFGHSGPRFSSSGPIRGTETSEEHLLDDFSNHILEIPTNFHTHGKIRYNHFNKHVFFDNPCL